MCTERKKNLIHWFLSKSGSGRKWSISFENFDGRCADFIFYFYCFVCSCVFPFIMKMLVTFLSASRQSQDFYFQPTQSYNVDYHESFPFISRLILSAFSFSSVGSSTLVLITHEKLLATPQREAFIRAPFSNKSLSPVFYTSEILIPD